MEFRFGQNGSSRILPYSHPKSRHSYSMSWPVIPSPNCEQLFPDGSWVDHWIFRYALCRFDGAPRTWPHHVRNWWDRLRDEPYFQNPNVIKHRSVPTRLCLDQFYLWEDRLTATARIRRQQQAGRVPGFLRAQNLNLKAVRLLLHIVDIHRPWIYQRRSAISLSVFVYVYWLVGFVQPQESTEIIKHPDIFVCEVCVMWQHSRETERSKEHDERWIVKMYKRQERIISPYIDFMDRKQDQDQTHTHTHH